MFWKSALKLDNPGQTVSTGNPVGVQCKFELPMFYVFKILYAKFPAAVIHMFG